MGTDAIAMVEVQMGSRWVPVLNPIWPNDGYRERDEDAFGMTPNVTRNYGLYSMLADVRNRSGRGKKTMMKQFVEGVGEIEFLYDTDDGGHDPLIPIALPRGVPDDANGAWREYQKISGTHDATWLTLQELEDADWDQVLYEQAQVPEKEYLRWLETGEIPGIQARGMGGPGMRIVNEIEYAAGVRGEKSTGVDFRWTGGTVRESVPTSWWATMAVMGLVAPEADYQKVRLLIAFDS